MAKGILTASRYCDYGEIIRELFSEIQVVITMDINTHAEISARQEALEKAGLADYSPYWLGRYLYKSHPTSSNRPRWREYVGNKPEFIKEAIDAVERRKQYARLQKEKRDIELRSYRIARTLLNLITVIKEQL